MCKCRTGCCRRCRWCFRQLKTPSSCSERWTACPRALPAGPSLARSFELSSQMGAGVLVQVQDRLLQALPLVLAAVEDPVELQRAVDGLPKGAPSRPITPSSALYSLWRSLMLAACRLLALAHARQVRLLNSLRECTTMEFRHCRCHPICSTTGTQTCCTQMQMLAVCMQQRPLRKPSKPVCAAAATAQRPLRPPALPGPAARQEGDGQRSGETGCPAVPHPPEHTATEPCRPAGLPAGTLEPDWLRNLCRLVAVGAPALEAPELCWPAAPPCR